MAGLLAYAAAGAAEGFGRGLVEEARGLREKALEEVRFQRQRILAGEDRTFRADEAEKGRNFSATEAEKQREFQGREGAANRGASAANAAAGRALQETLARIADARAGERIALDRERFEVERDAPTSTFTDETGNMRGLLRDGTARTIRGEDGEPVRPAASVDRQSATWRSFFNDNIKRQELTGDPVDEEAAAAAADRLTQRASGARPGAGGTGAATGGGSDAPAAEIGEEGAPVPGARRGSDGNWYVRQGDKFFRVQPDASAAAAPARASSGSAAAATPEPTSGGGLLSPRDAEPEPEAEPTRPTPSRRTTGASRPGATFGDTLDALGVEGNEPDARASRNRGGNTGQVSATRMADLDAMIESMGMVDVFLDANGNLTSDPALLAQLRAIANDARVPVQAIVSRIMDAAGGEEDDRAGATSPGRGGRR